jgi:hypothetical protein
VPRVTSFSCWAMHSFQIIILEVLANEAPYFKRPW